MKNLKDNIWIEGFVTKRKMVLKLSKGGYINTPIIYFGKTYDIPEEIAEECVLKMMRVDAEDLVHAMYRRYTVGNTEVQSLTH